MSAFHKRSRLGKQGNKEYTGVPVYKVRYLIDWESSVETLFATEPYGEGEVLKFGCLWQL